MLRTNLNAGLLLGLFAASACDAPPRAADTDTDGAGDTGDTGDDGDDGNVTTVDPTDPSQGNSGGEDESGSSDDGTGGSDDGQSGDDADDDDGTDTGADPGSPGMVFTLGNAIEGNTVVAFTRDADGALWELGEFATGGAGTAERIGSQGALTHQGEFLFAVNPGDDTISTLQIYDDHLGLVDIQDAGGERPTSVAVHGEHAYVLNAAGEGSVTGFVISDGELSPLEGASQPLSGAPMTAAAQVAVSPDGAYVVVTERATNQIVTYAVHDDGSLDAPVANPSSGITPFGFAFRDDGVLVVTEAFGGGMNPGASAASSHRVADGGGLWTFEASVPSGQTAACWVALAGAYAYASNTGSNTISAYHLDAEGALSLFGGGGVVADLGDDHDPIDIAVAGDDRFLYVLNATAENILGFSIDEGGTLTELGGVYPVPAGAVGLHGY